MVNTEKPTTKAEAKKQAPVNALKKEQINKAPAEAKVKKEEIKKVDKKPVKKTSSKKNVVVVNAHSVPVSAKTAKYICNFIKNKSIKKALEDLDLVSNKKIPVPMKGEIPHKKGKGMMSGRYPKRAAQNFVPLLKGLQGNANNHELENPIISEAIVNKAQRPFGRFGKWQRKRAHITLKARSKKIKEATPKKNIKENKKTTTEVKK